MSDDLPAVAPTIARHGRFLALAFPWVRLGFNVLPISLGGKSPAISGWGRTGELAERWELGARSVHSCGDPKLPWQAYVNMAQWLGCRDYNCAVLPGSGDMRVVDIDDPSQLEPVLFMFGPTPYRTVSGRVGGGVHLWYPGACRSRNAAAPGVDIKSNGGYVLAPGSLHAKTRQTYLASEALTQVLGWVA